MLQIQFKKLHENAVIPLLATANAACVDLVATEIEELSTNVKIVKLGFATAIPEGYKAVIVPRSSFTGYSWVLQNSPAQIDADYRGEWMLKFRAIPLSATTAGGYFIYDSFPYKVGERVAQMYLEKIVNYNFEVVEELPTTERAEGGFGSTGK